MSFIKKHKIEVFVVAFLIALAGFAAGTAYGSYSSANNGMAGRLSDRRMGIGADNGDGSGQDLPDGYMPDRGGRRHNHGGGMDRPDGMIPGQRPDGNTEPGAGQAPDGNTEPGTDQKPDTNTQPGQNQKPEDSTDATEKNDNGTEKNPDTTTQPKNNTTNNII